MQNQMKTSPYLIILGMSIVMMLNIMFGIFDNLSDRNEVYKVKPEFW